MTTARPFESEELASTAAERELLEAFTDVYRDVITAKLRGLPEDDARRNLVPLLTTLIGLVNHAAAVERNWFQHCSEQQPRSRSLANRLVTTPVGRSAQAGRSQTSSRSMPAVYDRCGQIAAGFALDVTVPHPHLGKLGGAVSPM